MLRRKEGKPYHRSKDFHEVCISLCSGIKKSHQSYWCIGVERGKDKDCFCSTCLGVLMLSPKISDQESHWDFWPSQAGIHVIKMLLTFEMWLGLR